MLLSDELTDSVCGSVSQWVARVACPVGPCVLDHPNVRVIAVYRYLGTYPRSDMKYNRLLVV